MKHKLKKEAPREHGHAVQVSWAPIVAEMFRVDYNTTYRMQL